MPGNSTQRFSGVALSAVQQTLDILGFMGLVGFIFGLLLPVLTLLDVEEVSDFLSLHARFCLFCVP